MGPNKEVLLRIEEMTTQAEELREQLRALVKYRTRDEVAAVLTGDLRKALLSLAQSLREVKP